MPPQITKQQFVCDIFEGIDHASANVIVFVYRDLGTGFIQRSMVLPRYEWSRLGCPMQITVTIEPGNTLRKDV